jgi:hypothetical protein
MPGVSVNVPELYEVFYNALEVMDRIFEFWMSGTFALVIAAYFIGENMSRLMFWLMSIGYLLFSAALAIRYMASAGKLVEMRVQLEAAGEVLPLSVEAGFGSSMVFVFGSAGTLIYLVQNYRNKGAT